LAKPVSTTGASGFNPIIIEQTTRISFLKFSNQIFVRKNKTSNSTLIDDDIDYDFVLLVQEMLLAIN
jgi:hypothetical protein